MPSIETVWGQRSDLSATLPLTSTTNFVGSGNGAAKSPPASSCTGLGSPETSLEALSPSINASMVGSWLAANATEAPLSPCESSCVSIGADDSGGGCSSPNFTTMTPLQVPSLSSSFSLTSGVHYPLAESYPLPSVEAAFSACAATISATLLQSTSLDSDGSQLLHSNDMSHHEAVAFFPHVDSSTDSAMISTDRRDTSALPYETLAMDELKVLENVSGITGDIRQPDGSNSQSYYRLHSVMDDIQSRRQMSSASTEKLEHQWISVSGL